MNPRLVVFDLDDTLADTAGTVLAPAEREAAATMVRTGLKTTVDEARRALREIRDEDPGAPFFARLVERFGADDPDACVAAARRTFFGNSPESIRLVDGARETLDALRARGIPLCLLTFGVVEAQRRKIEVLGIGDLFARIVIVPLERGPDKTAALREIFAGMNTAPSDAWVVGDRPPGEIRAGRSLGAVTIRVRSGEFARLEPAGPEERPDVTIPSIRELTNLLS